MNTVRALVVTGMSLALAASQACATNGSGGSAAPSGGTTPGFRTSDSRAPALRVTAIESHLSVPWDLTFLPDGSMLFTQRDLERITLRGPHGHKQVVADTPPNVWHSGETGMMSMLASRRFGRTRSFFTCYGSTASGTNDVRVSIWRLAKDNTSAHRTRTIVQGLPSTSGRHGGCRLRWGSEGALYIGTGDAATGTNPQDLTSGGGKVLRVVPRSGAGWPTNPFSHAANAMKRRIFTYGHRNVQGLALRSDGRMWSVEQGTDRDDEVNRLRGGGNYGWNPVPGYDESTPMTDYSLPGRQIGAKWHSGYPTIATSGGTWLTGKRWGSWQGCLAVATLKDSSLRILKFARDGTFLRGWISPELDGTYGRLRSPVMGPHHVLYITTSNDDGNDKILRVLPRS